MSSAVPRPRRAPRLTGPHDCELCDCPAYRWNLAPCALRTDPPETCRCNHPASRHRYRTAAR